MNDIGQSRQNKVTSSSSYVEDDITGNDEKIGYLQNRVHIGQDWLEQMVCQLIMSKGDDKVQ